MELGVYSLITPDYKVDEAAELVAEIGYTGIEWTLDYPDAVWDGKSRWHISTDDLEASAAAALDAARRNGLAIPSLGTRCNCLDAPGVRRAMEAARLVGASAVRVAAPSYGGKTRFDELFARARDAYENVEAIAREAGVKALVEVHHGLIAASASGTRRLLEGRDPRWVGAIFDPGNMTYEGKENWKMGAEILGPYLQHVHVKNATWTRNAEGRWVSGPASLAEGMVDWKEVLAALRSVGYDGFLNLEDLRGGWACKPVGITTEQKLREGFEYMSALL
jgi:sugar phosphate isomerase/epimerase